MLEIPAAVRAPAEAPASFGAGLRWERERRGIALEAIAEKTKVSARLFAGLEHDDLSAWPGGIFRRAFVRGYAEAVGLDPDKTLRDFLNAFPPEESEGPKANGSEASVSRASNAAPTTLRLTLADEGPAPWRYKVPATAVRLLAVAIDVSAVTVPALVVSALAPGHTFWIALACASLVYYVAGALLLDSTPGAWGASHLAGRRGRVRRGGNIISMHPHLTHSPLTTPLEARFYRRSKVLKF